MVKGGIAKCSQVREGVCECWGIKAWILLFTGREDEYIYLPSQKTASVEANNIEKFRKM